MPLSMTGFGEAHRHTDELAVGVEVRTINSRHFKLNLRASEGYTALEPKIESLVRQVVRRGTVQLNLRVARTASTDDYEINLAVLEGYLRQLESVGELQSAGRSIAVESLLPLPGVINERRDFDRDIANEWPVIGPVVESALESLAEMRRIEGDALANDLLHQVTQIADHRRSVEERAPQVQHGYRERLLDRINKAVSELNVTIEPAELVREIALFVDRSDISEEIVRLGSHIDQFRAALRADESTGRKLEFIAQEMGREINTIGSKANDTQISGHVVEMKTCLERIREQVQNVE